MKKFYKIALLFILFIFLTSYNPNKFDLIFEDNSNFFRIKKIVVINNLLVEKNPPCGFSLTANNDSMGETGEFYIHNFLCLLELHKQDL